MGRKSAHTGMSPKDRSINLMDKFISRNNNKHSVQIQLPARRKDPNIPVDLWPFKDQIDYWENRTDADRFNDAYSSYSTWYSEVKAKSGVYHRTFDEFVYKLREEMQKMWEKKTMPKDAVLELRKFGVY
jgi:hypothetical protein